MNIKGILFDKDGTLIEFSTSWMPAIIEAANYFSKNDPIVTQQILAASGYDDKTNQVLAGSLLAAANNQQIAQCWSQFIDIEADQNMVDKLDEIFQYHSQHSSVAATDLHVLFDNLISRNIKLGVATSDSEQGARKTLEAFGVAQKIDFICGYNSGHGIKPESGMVDAFCEQMKLLPSEVMVVGDNTHDLHMAKNAGAKLSIGVLTGTSSAVKLHEANYILDHIGDIPELLDSIT
ncbi:MAG: phosphoglycolate phosphatase [Oceanospirillaceae bacterium]